MDFVLRWYQHRFHGASMSGKWYASCMSRSEDFNKCSTHENPPTMLLLLVHREGPNLLSDVDEKGWTAAHWASNSGNSTALRLSMLRRASSMIFNRVALKCRAEDSSVFYGKFIF